MRPRRDHMPCLDGLRGLAAALVVLGHAPLFGGADVLGADANSFGVLVFFVLSGFLIGHLYLDGPATPAAVADYLRARLARIVPLYYLVVGASFALSLAAGLGFAYGLTLPGFGRALLFSSNVAVFWSIGPEVQFYLLFVALWIVRARGGERAFVAAALAASALCVATIGHWPGVLVLSKLHIFCCGLLCAVYRGRAEAALGRRGIAAAHLLSLAVLAALAFDAASLPGLRHCVYDRAADPAYACFFGDLPRLGLVGFVVLSCSLGGWVAELALAGPPARALGRCSFSLYLLHEPVFDLLGAAGVPAALGPAATTVLGFGATVAVSLASYRLVEAPAQALVKRIFRPPALTPGAAGLARPTA